MDTGRPSSYRTKAFQPGEVLTKAFIAVGESIDHTGAIASELERRKLHVIWHSDGYHLQRRRTATAEVTLPH